MYALLIPLLILCLLMGMPIFAVILAAAMTGFLYQDIDLTAVAIELYRLEDMPLLVSLPLFTFAGYILSESNASQRLLNLVKAVFGWIPDGLAIIVIIACAIFTAFTGASGVTILALGALLYPAMIKAGYRDRFSMGLITTSGSLGLLLPPSVPLIIYGIIMQQMNIGGEYEFQDIFLAGLIPALLMIVMLAAYVLWDNRHINIPRTAFSLRDFKQACRSSAWDFPLPVIIFAGIFSGVLAVSELAAITALYILIVEVLVHRDIKLKQLPTIAAESMTMIGGILLILAAAMAFTNFLIDAEIPNSLFLWIKQHIDSKLTFLLLLNIFLLLVGAVLDIFSALVIIVPLILPVAISYGINPIHLGVIFLANMQIGYITPPVGMNLFIASHRFNRPVLELYHASLPFLLVSLLAVLLITYWPGLSLLLIN